MRAGILTMVSILLEMEQGQTERPFSRLKESRVSKYHGNVILQVRY